MVLLEQEKQPSVEHAHNWVLSILFALKLVNLYVKKLEKVNGEFENCLRRQRRQVLVFYSLMKSRVFLRIEITAKPVRIRINY